MGYYHFIAVANKVTGPYSHFIALKEPRLDTSLFQDTDVKIYVIWPENEIHPVDLSKIDDGVVMVGPKISRAAGPALEGFSRGHQSEFIGPDGHWWTCYKHERSANAPWLNIDPIHFAPNGDVAVAPSSGPQSIPSVKYK